MKLTTIVLAINTPGAIALKQIIDKGFNVVLLVSRKVQNELGTQPYVVAESNNIPVMFTEDLNKKEVIEKIQQINPDVIISSWFHLKIPDAIIKSSRLVSVNFHPSYLPQYRSATPVEWAIINGEQTTGLTCHLLNSRYDSGNILWQRRVDINPNETSGELAIKIANYVTEGLDDLLHRVEKKDFVGVMQDEHKASCFRKRTINDAIIDWTWPAKKIHDQIRAMNPWPLARTSVNGDTILVSKSERTQYKHSLKPGTIVKHINDEILVACGQGESLLLKGITLPRLICENITNLILK